MSNSKPKAAEVTQETLNSFKALQKSAFVLGYTGEVGKELTRAVLQSGVFKRVVLIGRRKVDYSGDPLLKDVEQAQVDFDKILEHEDVFKNFDVGYCCLGTTRSKHGAAEFVKVEYEYPVNAARAAKSAGVKQYQLVSSSGAKASSWNLYMQTKGRTEKAITELGFERFTIMRPGFLLCDRVEHRTVERGLKILFTPVFKLAPTYMSVPTRSVGLAMLYQTVVQANETVHVVENARIHELASKVPEFEPKK